MVINDRYRLEAEIGRGGMGTVYRAYDTLLERPVAVKILHETSLGSQGRARLLREAQSAARLNHPNITAVYDAGETDNAPYIVMELVPEGKTLRDQPPASFEAIAALGLQICAALQHAQSHGIVHRDLKPENILLTQPPSSQGDLPHTWAKLTDFGLARSVKDPRLTEEGAVIGTLYYIAPEQASGAEIDGRADLYALGVMLYELSTGKLPFTGDHPVAVLMQHLSQPPAPPSTLRPEIPAALEAAILKLLEKKPANRFASAAETAQALSELAPTVRPVQPAPAQGNLPTELTSFIGRQRQIDEIKTLLDDYRLVTLTGPGGCGKTRLELRLAAELQPNFADGAWLVDLAALTDPAQTPAAVAAALGVREETGRPWMGVLTGHLRQKQLLLVLDNCEHLVEACAQLAVEILRQCPQVRLLASSRAALNIAGEAPYRVPPLSIPDPDQLPALAELADYEAVRLFTERAAAAAPGFSLTAQNAAAIAQVCARLDGIPLALELAAARISVLSVAQIAARLDDRFRLLTGGKRSALPHHQTLRLCIDWGYDLLAGPEQALFRQLSVFASGWSLEATEVVCPPGSADSLELLAHLVDHSLVVVEPGDERRYHMLETIRQYASEKLLQAGEMETSRTRHLEYFSQYAVQASKKMIYTEESETWFMRLRAETDNMRTALEWSLQSQQFETGLELAGAAALVWYFSGAATEGRRWLSILLDRTSGATPPRAGALSAASVLAYQQTDYGEARALGELGVAMWRSLNDRRGLAEAVHMLGHVVFDQGDLAAARQMFSESLELYDALNETVPHLTLVSDLGLVAYFLGDYPTARRYYQESLQAARQKNISGDIAQTLTRLGDLERLEGNYAQAEEFYRECLSKMQALNTKLEIASALHKLSFIARHADNLPKARLLLQESLILQQESGNKQGIAECLFALAGVCGAEGREPLAVQLFAAAQAFLDQVGAPLAPADRVDSERDLTALRASLGDEAFQTAWEQGKIFVVDDAISLAR